MPFPANWPPRPSTGVRSIRFFVSGTGTANFADNAYLFIEGAGANPFVPAPDVPYGSGVTVNNPLTPTGTGATQAPVVPAQIWSGTMRVCNDGGSALEFSFDGINVHGRLLPGDDFSYRNRYEAGISLRGNGVAFRVEAW